ncbi:MAG TPA: MFS transporter, partial [Rhizomicrobium sp.]|nr:MFS transporter [Rhizomicrobium sp.]
MSGFKETGSRSSDDPSAGEPSGAPASMAAVQAGAVADVTRHPLSATGGPVAKWSGQIAWAMFDFARTPYVLLITIYIFAPYFTNTLVSDPVKGQAMWGDIQGYSGLIIAVLAPFIGAIADAGGSRKQWIAVFSLVMIVATAALWYAQPGGIGLSLLTIGVLVAATNVAYEFSSVFYNAMLPTIVTHERIGSLSGLSLALGNVSGLILLIFLLIGFVLPGAVDWSFIPAHPLFGI